MKKCILLVRVSTQVQNYDEQENVVYDMAIKDGYLPSNIISVCEKESGIRLSEEERKGLNLMKEYIEKDSDIDCVYVFELDRLGRKKKVLFSVVDYLVSHKVNLIIKEPNRIELLNKDKSINESSEMIITLFAQLAESEMRNKLSRFKRSKDANKKIGRYNGGKVMFGYVVNKDGYYEVDPDNIVLDIFTMYSKGDVSYQDIVIEFKHRGYFLDLDARCARHRIYNILNERAYYGACSTINNVVYPAIISKELFDKCKSISSGKSFVKGRNTKKTLDKSLLCKGLIFNEDNYSMYCDESIFRYMSSNRRDCDLSSISSKVVDAAVWFVVAPYYKLYKQEKDESYFVDIKYNIDDLNKKINVSDKLIKDYQNRLERLDESIYVLGKVSIDRGEKMKSELYSKIKKEESLIIEYKLKINEYEYIIEQHNQENDYFAVDDIANITDLNIRYDIIHDLVEKIVVKRCSRYVYDLHIKLKVCNEFVYRIDCYNKRMLLHNKDIMTGDELWMDLK